MEYIKIISLIDHAKALESAQALSRAGADELLFQYESEQDLEIIKEITNKLDIPIGVRMTPDRFEDVKKVLYAGAASVCLETEKEEVIREVVGRFGDEKISGLLKGDFTQNMEAYAAKVKDYGYGQLYFAECEKLEAQQGELVKLGKLLSIPILVYLSEGCLEASWVVEFLKQPGAGGVVLPPSEGLEVNAIKQTFQEKGLSVNTFTSAIPFSEFKLNGDGLIPVVVQDYKTNQVLMMAYMNEEAYNKTVSTGQMTYYSRSRQELWLKGETSGHYQYVKELRLDCDNDTILAKVEQIGAACHTGSYSCFFQELVKREYHEKNPLTILKEDYDVIAERKEHPKEGSYTNYLFDKGVDKILKKVGEEATEIVIAAKNPDAGELKYEISDFLYHMMVLMVDQGLTWEDITEELARRR